MNKELWEWTAFIGLSIGIVKTLGQGSIIAFRKLSEMTDRHRAALIFLNVLSCIVFLSFMILRWTLPAGGGVPLALLVYIILDETAFCVGRREVTRGRIFWGAVYPALIFGVFFMEWYVRVSLR